MTTLKDLEKRISMGENDTIWWLAALSIALTIMFIFTIHIYKQIPQGEWECVEWNDARYDCSYFLSGGCGLGEWLENVTKYECNYLFTNAEKLKFEYKCDYFEIEMTEISKIKCIKEQFVRDANAN